ncbi:Oligoribonuclease, mitochondrial [Lunasporangiospora selenospora]|uniref:Oligoribonuclease, mitochondrial n=1 Tax=Lunasporangiospora selenospora TaxID=979761 RepID=A0A9P6KJ56_9FUNG|nr:Oligoribonuclease, mitochondrial [Lunasporangiospora selenospora]
MAPPSLVWIDCEMTGLSATDKLIEIAVLITDDDLNIVEEGPSLIIRQPKEVMDNMNEWCVKHHGESGLTAAVLASNVSTDEACSQVLTFVKKHIPQAGRGILAGNSVHADKVFLDREMRSLMDHLHYRIVDVSTVKELARRWFPKEFADVPPKQGAHRALDDIKESITELKYYRRAIFL